MGLIANWKITTGRLAIGALRSVLQNWLFSAVNSSGAVSPEMRASASNTGHNTAPHRSQRSPSTPPALRCAQPPGHRLAQTVRHQLQHILGLPHNHRHRDDGQRDSTGPRQCNASLATIIVYTNRSDQSMAPTAGCR